MHLRFSKSGNPEIERAYATHYVDLGRVEQLKKERQEKADVLKEMKRSDGEQPDYFSIKPTETARDKMRKYLKKKFDEVHRIVRENTDDSIFSKVDLEHS